MGLNSRGNFSELQLLSDPAKLKARIDSLEAAQKSADEAVALVGPANEIAQMRAQAEQALSKARETLDRAEAEAEKLLESAHSEAAAILGDAQSRSDAINAESESVKAESKSTLADAKRILADATRKDVASDDRNSDLNRLSDSLAQEASVLQEGQAALTLRTEHVNSLTTEFVSQLSSSAD